MGKIYHVKQAIKKYIWIACSEQGIESIKKRFTTFKVLNARKFAFKHERRIPSSFLTKLKLPYRPNVNCLAYKCNLIFFYVFFLPTQLFHAPSPPFCFQFVRFNIISAFSWLVTFFSWFYFSLVVHLPLASIRLYFARVKVFQVRVQDILHVWTRGMDLFEHARTIAFLYLLGQCTFFWTWNSLVVNVDANLTLLTKQT